MSQIRASSTQIEEEPGYTIGQDAYGLDVLTRPFHGPAADWPRFAAKWKGATPDYAFKDYFLTGRNLTGQRGLLVRANLTFKGVPGLASGKPSFSLPTLGGGLMVKTILLKLSDNSGRTCEIDYMAPYSTWKYATGVEPTSGLHEGEIRPFDKPYQIIRARGNTNYPVSFVSGPMTFTTNRPQYYFVYVGVVSIFEKNQEGKAWTVNERNEGTLYGVENKTTGTGGRITVTNGT